MTHDTAYAYLYLLAPFGTMVVIAFACVTFTSSRTYRRMVNKRAARRAVPVVVEEEAAPEVEDKPVVRFKDTPQKYMNTESGEVVEALSPMSANGWMLLPDFDTETR